MNSVAAIAPTARIVSPAVVTTAVVTSIVPRMAGITVIWPGGTAFGACLAARLWTPAAQQQRHRRKYDDDAHNSQVLGQIALSRHAHSAA